MQEIFAKQEELMNEVPHPLTPEASSMSYDGIRVIEALIYYINALGRKPWRPSPLPYHKVLEAEEEFGNKVLVFKARIRAGAGPKNSEVTDRMMVSTLGVIEEAIEAFNDMMMNCDRAKILEEYVDILFFWAELGLENGFTWPEIKAEYMRKWAINMKRYADAKVGDMTWDDRKDKTTL